MKAENSNDDVIAIPMRAAATASRTRGLSTLGWLFLAATLAQIIAANPYINLYDEGIILVGAEQVWRGHVPYRDFWTMYGPAQFYLASWLFSVFGPTDIAVRAIGLVAKSAITVLSYAAVARAAPKSMAAAAALAILGMLIALRQDAFPIFPAVALALAAILLIERGLLLGPAWLVAAGVCTGLAAAFRHDLGAYNALAIGAGLLFINRVWSCRDNARRAAVAIGWYALGILLIMAPVAGLLISAVPLADLYENLIHFPSRIYPANRALPFPGATELALVLRRPLSASGFAVYAPFVICFWVLSAEIVRATTKRSATSTPRPVENGTALVVLLALTCLLFIAKGLVRVSTIHMAPALVLSAVLIAIEAARSRQRTPAARRVVLAGLSLPAFLLVLLGVDGWYAVARNIPTWTDPEKSLAAHCLNPVLPRLRCAAIDPDYLSAARLVDQLSEPGDHLYVGAGRHDKIFVNAVAFYFAAARRPVTRWYELHPGLQTQTRIQREIIEAMTTAPPRLIVLDSRWDAAAEPNASSHSSGQRRLDDYIRQHYAEIRRFGTVSVLAPRSGLPTKATPAAAALNVPAPPAAGADRRSG